MRSKKILIGVPMVIGTFIGLVGALHLPAGRPILAWIGMGCPLRASPEATEAARIESARAARGSAAAPVRPALGFDLGKTTREEIAAWALQRGVSCSESQQGTIMKCENVPSLALDLSGPSIDDLTFGFEPSRQTLVTVTTLRSRLDSAGAEKAMRKIAADLSEKLGAGRAVGEPTAEYLAAGPMHTALVEYRFTNYLADVSATNLGPRVAVREHYMSID